MTGGDRMASLVEHALDTVPCDVVLVPTRGGTTARVISRCKPPVWIVAPMHAIQPPARASRFPTACIPSISPNEPADWREFAARWLPEHGLTADRVMLVAGPSSRNPNASHRIELMRLGAPDS